MLVTITKDLDLGIANTLQDVGDNTAIKLIAAGVAVPGDQRKKDGATNHVETADAGPVETRRKK